MTALVLKWAAGAAAAALVLAACAPVVMPVEGLRGPATRAAPRAAAPAPVPSLQSQAMTAFYRHLSDSFAAKGLLRQDNGQPDVPFTQRDLVEDFIKIALYEEYVATNDRLVQRQTESILHRWEEPVRVRLVFGQSVPASQRQKDEANINAYLVRLARISGRPVYRSELDPNYFVFMVNEDERIGLAEDLKLAYPAISETEIRTITEMPRSTYCLVFAWDPADDGVYKRAVAVIRGEHPDLLRLSCIHEEIAQGLGLSNDSPQARPSIFNDDEEFALLTRHDEMLLAMLYDPRMHPGMSVDEARPVAEAIAAELFDRETAFTQ